MSTEGERRSRLDVLLLTLSACVEHGVWRASSTANYFEHTLAPLVELLTVAAAFAGALACWFLRPRFAAIAMLGVVTFGCFMVNDHNALAGATLVNAGHYAFLPCVLALFAERIDAEGASPGRYARVSAFLLLLQAPLGLAPLLVAPRGVNVGAALGSVNAICILLMVGPLIALGSLRASPLGPTVMPPPSAYRGPQPRDEGKAGGSLAALVPLVLPALVFAFIAGARPVDPKTAEATAVVRSLVSVTGALVFWIVARRRSTHSPLTVFGGALVVGGLAWALTSLPATWERSDAGFMSVVGTAAPLATAYAVFAVGGRHRAWVIGAWCAMTALATFAGQHLPHREDWVVFVAILAAALAIVSGAWLVRNAAKVQARIDGAP